MGRVVILKMETTDECHRLGHDFLPKVFGFERGVLYEVLYCRRCRHEERTEISYESK